MNLAELQKENIKEYGEYVSLIFEEKGESREYTNQELFRLSNKFAYGLKRLGFNKGDKVIVTIPNCPEVFISYAGTWKAGGIITPVIFLLQAEEMEHIFSDCQPKFVITSPLIYEKVKLASQNVSSVKNIILTGEEKEGKHKVVLFNDLLKMGEEEFPPEEMEPEDLAVILYTAGTTGKPKGVMLTHQNLYLEVKLMRETVLKYSPEYKREIALSCLPLSHVYGLMLMLGGWLFGGKGVIMPWFEPQEVFKAIEKYKIKGMPGVPTMFISMLNHPDADKYDLSSVELWLSAAAPLPVEIKEAFEKKFGGKILQGYGLTETASAVSVTPRDMPKKPINCVGKPIEGIEVKIFDENNKELKPGESGEIVVKGPTVMKGYYNLPEETERALAKGWLHTGDIGYFDEEGYLYIMERKKDLIIRGGFNIFPKDVEEVLMQHPKVMEAAVVGVPDKLYGEEVKAFVVLRPGEKATEEEIIEFCRTKLAKFKSPKSIEFRSFLPKNPMGKVLKKELRKL